MVSSRWRGCHKYRRLQKNSYLPLLLFYCSIDIRLKTICHCFMFHSNLEEESVRLRMSNTNYFILKGVTTDHMTGYTHVRVKSTG